MFGLSTFQVVAIALGLYLLYNSVDMTTIKNFFGKFTQPAVDKPVDKGIINVPSTPVTINVEPQKTILAVVKEWEELRNICVKQGLTATVKKLDDAFPTILDLTKAVDVTPKEDKNV